MPSSSTGKWVSRVAATGGGRTYRGQVPVNWYAALIIIVVLGLVSIVFARYEYQHPHGSSTVQPAVGHTLFAGYAFDICGKVQAPLAASSGDKAEAAGITTLGLGVLDVSPHTPEEAGNNAILAQFFDSYPGVSLSADRLEINHKTYRNGQVCPSGTPDAGKPGVVKVATWTNPLTNTSTVLSGNPAATKVLARALYTFGFVPQNAKLPKPPQSVVNNMLGYAASVTNGTTTTTTAPSSTSTTAPAATTTTTAPSTTTTTKA